MKNFTKKFLKTLLMLTCVFALTACGQDDAISANQQLKQKNAEAQAQNVVRMTAALVLSQDNASAMFDEYNNIELADVFSSLYAEYTRSSTGTGEAGITCEGKAVRNAFRSFESGIEDMGNITEIGQPVSTISDDTITVQIPIRGENANGSVELIFTNDIYLAMTSCTLNMDETKGELMGRAALNTLLGMGTVFVVLILISLIISVFSLIPKMQEKLAKKEAPAQAPSPAPVAAAPVVEAAEEELADDTELVAVIAAAIAAYEGTSVEGFQVRSIRRANTGKWKRA
ncbi:MAG: OadG family protein [Lachnospiraceae bacterium]|nr:OadG family protein [Lachnospiraceae bacterium]